MTYKVAKMMITNGNYEYNDMLKKLDIFLLGNRITQEQYTELVGLLNAAA
ncbi:hypothetical protein [Acetobacterium wieringae]|nr:hypothetical protein [Acetobacterium wieringae]